MADVFVSYAREDQPFVRRLHEALAVRGRETSGALLRTLARGETPVQRLSFSPDSTRVVADGTALVWDACAWCFRDQDLLFRAKTHVTRCFTAAERGTFLHEDDPAEDAPCAVGSA